MSTSKGNDSKPLQLMKQAFPGLSWAVSVGIPGNAEAIGRAAGSVLIRMTWSPDGLSSFAGMEVRNSQPVPIYEGSIRSVDLETRDAWFVLAVKSIRRALVQHGDAVLQAARAPDSAPHASASPHDLLLDNPPICGHIQDPCHGSWCGYGEDRAGGEKS